MSAKLNYLFLAPGTDTDIKDSSYPGKTADLLIKLHREKIPVLPAFIARIAAVREYLAAGNIDALTADLQTRFTAEFGNNYLFDILVESDLPADYHYVRMAGITSDLIMRLRNFLPEEEIIRILQAQIKISAAGDLPAVSAPVKSGRRKKDTRSGAEEVISGFNTDEHKPPLFRGAKEAVSVLLPAVLQKTYEEHASLIITPSLLPVTGQEFVRGTFCAWNIPKGTAALSGQYTSARLKGKITGKLTGLKNMQSRILPVLHKINSLCSGLREAGCIISGKKFFIASVNNLYAVPYRTEIKFLFYRLKKGEITASELIKAVNPRRISELLIAQFEKKESSGKTIRGGVIGSTGNACGRIFFSSRKLSDAWFKAKNTGQNASFILALPETYAQDVPAMKLSAGIISSEGGYSSHAAVVSRNLGKPNIINNNLKFSGHFLSDGKIKIKEGDFVSLQAVFSEEPAVISGKTALVPPDIKNSGLPELLALCKNSSGPQILANADTPADARISAFFQADGIGLCRTEHMFFQNDRLPYFISLLLGKDDENINDKIKSFFTADFCSLFRSFPGKTVTIRLLDAPLHEFIPRDADRLKKITAELRRLKIKTSPAELKALTQKLHEKNPMLGHRGVRSGITRPQIYNLQAEAAFTAQILCRSSKVHLAVMIPLVGLRKELDFSLNGKKIEGEIISGVHDAAEKIQAKYKIRLPYSAGTMIELPSAVFISGELARHAEFFSFGTNDLTQTAMGISRDDAEHFLPVYAKYDIMGENPFSQLLPAVQEMISLSLRRGRKVRPDLKACVCGEHASSPENLDFFLAAGLNGLSCPVYSIPMIKIALFQKLSARQA